MVRNVKYESLWDNLGMSDIKKYFIMREINLQNFVYAFTSVTVLLNHPDNLSLWNYLWEFIAIQFYSNKYHHSQECVLCSTSFNVFTKLNVFMCNSFCVFAPVSVYKRDKENKWTFFRSESVAKTEIESILSWGNKFIKLCLCLHFRHCTTKPSR